MMRRAGALGLVFLSLDLPALAFQWAEPAVQGLLQVDGTTPQDTFGWQVLPIGDVNGDGTGDFAVSAPLSAVGAQAAGLVTAFSGTTGAVLWSRSETVQSSVLGYTMDVLDWDGDGVLDVLAAAPFAGSVGGRVHVFAGQSGVTLHTYDNPGVPGDNFGASLALRGDYDGDGVDDIAFGATQVDVPGATNAGKVYVFSGATNQLLTSIDAPLQTPGDFEFGIGLAFLGDVSQPPDGRDDLVVTCRHVGFSTGAATAYRFDGSTSHVLWSIDGVVMDFNLMGNRCDGGRDVDGDGLGDFAVGSTQGNTARVCSGLDGSTIWVLDGNGEGGSFGAGHMVPDADGDGRADLLYGASSNDTGASNAGKVFLYSGRTGAVIRTMTPLTPDKRIGREARSAGDHDGDGVLDFVVAGGGGGTSGPPPGRFAVVRGLDPFTGFCTATPNSTGFPAHVFATGTGSASAHDLVLHVEHATNGAGLFIHGASTAQIPFGDGIRCVTGSVRRGPVLTPSGGAVSSTYDGSLPGLDLAVHAGTVRHFQFWFRDVAAAGAGFNLSDGVSVPIWP